MRNRDRPRSTREGYGSYPSVHEEIRELLGTTAPPPSVVSDDASFRASYYAASYRLARPLVAIGGLPKFLELYAAEGPPAAVVRLYGEDLQTPVAAALK